MAVLHVEARRSVPLADDLLQARSLNSVLRRGVRLPYGLVAARDQCGRLVPFPCHFGNRQSLQQSPLCPVGFVRFLELRCDVPMPFAVPSVRLVKSDQPNGRSTFDRTLPSTSRCEGEQFQRRADLDRLVVIRLQNDSTHRP